MAGEDGRDEADLERRRHDVEDEAREDEVDRAGAAVEDALQAARLAPEVEAQVERVEVAEEVPRDEADGALGDGREDDVAELGEGGRRDAREAIWGEGMGWGGVRARKRRAPSASPQTYIRAGGRQGEL